MRLRGATKADLGRVYKLISETDFHLDVKHMECLVVIEHNDEIIAIGSLVTLLEAMFVTDKSKSSYVRAKALKLLMKQTDTEVQRCGYDNFTVYTSNSQIHSILLDKFRFVPVIGRALIKWIKEG